MKPTIFWVLRHLLVPAGLMWAVGIFTCINWIQGQKTTEHQFSVVDTTELEMTPASIKSYADSLLLVRETQVKQAGEYSPYDYFHDLKQFKMFEAKYADSLNNTAEGSLVILRYLSSAGSTLGTLVSLRDEAWRTKRSRADIDSARAQWFPADTVRETTHSVDPNYSIWEPLLLWGWDAYLKGIPFALLMLLGWRIRCREESDNDDGALFDRPLSLLFSLALWPIFLAIDLRNRWNSVLHRSEVLSRRENLLSFFSKEDESLIKLGQRMSQKEFRNYLDSLGRKRHHSFTKALVVTCCMLVLLPRSHGLEPVPPVQYTYAVITSECRRVNQQEYIHPPPKQKRDVFERKEQALFHFLQSIGQVMEGFARRTEGIPRIGIYYSK